MSRLPFELLLALRYLRPKRTFVSVITLISVLGVALGVAVLMIVISVMSGFDQQLRDKILGFNTHLKVFEPEHTISDYKRVMSIISSNREVKAQGPFVIDKVLLQTEPGAQGQARPDTPFLRGIVPQLETNLTILPRSIVEGNFDVSDRGLLIGKEFAQNMRLEVGDRVSIYSVGEIKKWQKSIEEKQEKVSAGVEFEVRGIFDVGYYDYNAAVVVASLQDAQDLYDLGNSVHGIMVMLKEPNRAPQVAGQLEAVLGPNFRVTTWMQENANILNALVVEKNVQFIVLFFTMIVAALCILSALITFVIQKTREIGMLKALGATDLQVAGIFLSQGAFVGAIGDVAGYCFARLALAYRNEFLHFMDRVFGFSLFPPSIYQFTELPALILARDSLLICGSAWIICILGGVIPAWRAGRLKPVEALRYE
jgi:ABC-type transport system, involved in lipoprotein release, permease component